MLKWPCRASEPHWARLFDCQIRVFVSSPKPRKTTTLSTSMSLFGVCAYAGLANHRFWIHVGLDASSVKRSSSRATESLSECSHCVTRSPEILATKNEEMEHLNSTKSISLINLGPEKLGSLHTRHTFRLKTT